MSLKAGRVGVNPADVDPVSGRINSSSTEGYTKAEADDKFLSKSDASDTYETKSNASTALAEKQPINLQVPISMLSGTKTKVEDALQGLNVDKIDNTVIESACTDIVEGATSATNKLYKCGHMITLCLDITNVTATSGDLIAKLPNGFKPPVDLVFACRNTNGIMFVDVMSSGNIKTKTTLSNVNVQLTATWIIS